MANAFEGFEQRVKRAVTDLEEVLLNGTDYDVIVECLKQTSCHESNKWLPPQSFDDIFKQPPVEAPTGAPTATPIEAPVKSSTGYSQQRCSTCRTAAGCSSSSLNSSTSSTVFESSDSSYKGFEFPFDRLERPTSSIRPRSFHTLFNLDSSEHRGRCLCETLSPELWESEIFKLQTVNTDDVDEDFLNANPEYPTRIMRRDVIVASKPAELPRNRPLSVDASRAKRQNMFIGSPRASGWVPTTPKCSPQVRYNQYKEFWEKFPIPGEEARRELRWAIRNQMAKKEELQKRSWWPEVKLRPKS